MSSFLLGQVTFQSLGNLYTILTVKYFNTFVSQVHAQAYLYLKNRIVYYSHNNLSLS